MKSSFIISSCLISVYKGICWFWSINPTNKHRGWMNNCAFCIDFCSRIVKVNAQQTSGIYDFILYFVSVHTRNQDHAGWQIKDKMGQKTHKKKREIWKVTPQKWSSHRSYVVWTVINYISYALCVESLNGPKITHLFKKYCLCIIINCVRKPVFLLSQLTFVDFCVCVC